MKRCPNLQSQTTNRAKTMSRRAVMVAGFAAAASAYQEHGDVPLRNLGQPCGMLVGAQLTKDDLDNNRLVGFVREHFNILTAGLELKWASLRPTPDSYRFQPADQMFAFAKANQMRFHGHNLCWNAANPAWFPHVLTKANAERYLVDHIKTVARRYAGQVHSWDVVNEPIDYRSSRPDGLREGPWLDLLGPEYIDTAFHALAEADPRATRVLNIFGVELDFEKSTFARSATLALLTRLVRANVPVQAVGLESHLDGHAKSSSPGRTQFISEVHALGLQVLITEMDVDDLLLPANVSERDRLVATSYHDYLIDVVPVARPPAIIFWTPSDWDNWLDRTPGSAHQRADRLLHRPGLLDAQLRPKPALDAVTHALRTSCGH